VRDTDLQVTAMKFQHRTPHSARLALSFILPNKALSLAIDRFSTRSTSPMFPWAHLAPALSGHSSPTLRNPAILQARQHHQPTHTALFPAHAGSTRVLIMHQVT
jgi:hypothetical protein